MTEKKQKYTEAKKRANKKWNAENLKRIGLVIKKGDKPFIVELAKKQDKSLNRLFLDAFNYWAKNNNIDIEL